MSHPPNEATEIARLRIETLLDSVRTELEHTRARGVQQREGVAPPENEMFPFTLPHYATTPLPSSHCDAVHVNAILCDDDDLFLLRAYHRCLHRCPDRDGFRSYREKLARGELDQLTVLRAMLDSTEGRARGATVRGLRLRATIDRASVAYPRLSRPAAAVIRWCTRPRRRAREIIAIRDELYRLAAVVNGLASDLERTLNCLQGEVNLKADQWTLEAMIAALAEMHSDLADGAHQLDKPHTLSSSADHS